MSEVAPSTNASRILLTPGPLTVSTNVHTAMLSDWGSRDADFLELTARIRHKLVSLADAEGTHECVLLQGSGTFATEAALGTCVRSDDGVLVIANGAYGRRIARMLAHIGRRHTLYEIPEDRVPDVGRIAELLTADPMLRYVALVHCETTTGILNPLSEVAALTSRLNRRLIVDAISSFGALPISIKNTPIDVLIASSNKCLQGAPGVGIVLARRDILVASSGHAHSVSLDLHDQWRNFVNTGEWRFTPPTHVVAALGAALDELAAEGGPEARRLRYQQNCEVLVAGMRTRGFRTLLDSSVQAPIIVTFKMPSAEFSFELFYLGLHRRGFVIYPGKLTKMPTFRVGCIGAIDQETIVQFLRSVDAVIASGETRNFVYGATR